MIASKSAAQRWGEDRERHLLQHGPPATSKKEVPTLQEFVPGFSMAMRGRIDRSRAASRRRRRSCESICAAARSEGLDAITNEASTAEAPLRAGHRRPSTTC